MVLKLFYNALIVTAALCLTAGCTKETRMVKLQTSMGDIILELNEDKAPVTTNNFITYVQENFYDDTIFHRVIPNFMIQCGGFTPDMEEKKTNPPITNEAANGLENIRGTIAMARTSDPHSATSQFFINLIDNQHLDSSAKNPGYTVFGKVVEGMDIVDKIAKVKTAQNGQHANVPVEPILIQSVNIIAE